MIPYILYTALILSACLIFYKLLLQKETFFHLNRFVLLSCMMLAFILPLLPVPQQLSFRNEPEVKQIVLAKTSESRSAVKQIKEQPVQKALVEESKQIINVELFVKWMVYFYWFGVLIFALNFLMQIVILLYKAYSKAAIQDGKFRIVEIKGDKAPCSFANIIFINPEKYEWEMYNQILLHEKIHIEQKHTIDLLLSEVVLIFQWFNPFAWQWRKVLESNLEFLTDNQMLLQDTVEKESYQFSLLKVAAPQFPLSLTTNYNQSLLKKRIVMMNSKKSNVNTTWKYFFLVPLMVLFVCLFNQPAAQSQTLTAKEKPEDDINSQKEMKTEGDWFATIKGNTINIQFKSDEDDTSSSSFQLNDFGNLPRDKEGSFTLTREAGTMNFVGKFEGDKGMGTYKFVSNEKFKAAMAKEDVDIVTDNDLMLAFIVNVKHSYVQMLKKKGYDKLTKDEIVPMTALNVYDDYISSIKEAGIVNISIDELISFRALGIDKAYIDEIRKSGYKNSTPDNIIALKSQGIDAKYIADFKNSTESNSGDDLDDDIVAFKSMNIDQAFINSYKELGFKNLSNDDLLAMKSLNVTPEYIRDFQNSGFKNIKPDELFALKSQNITPELIKEYKNLGFNDLTIDDVVGAKVMGVTPSFIKSMKDKGHDFKNLEKYIEIKTVFSN